jgi:hypothetical protein
VSKPSFLKGTTLDPQEREYYADLTSNWLKIHSKLHSFSEEALKKMILLEMQRGARLHILHRLKRRYDRLRGDRERREMLIAL